MSIVAFLLMLAPLVIVHELGHFLFAKLFNVKAEAFSVGFGPRLFAKKWGETEFRLSLIPLGGYVKLLGEEPGVELPPEERPRALQYQSVGKRFWIFFGGPLFNFLFAILVYMTIMAVGEPKLANVVGRVIPGSFAEQVGFQSGDRIVSVAGEPVALFDSVMEKIAAVSQGEVSVQVERTSVQGDTQTPVLRFQPELEDGFGAYGESQKVGAVPGLEPFVRTPIVGVARLDSFAAKEGVKTGDRIVSLNGTAVESWEQVELLYAKISMGDRVRLELSSGDASKVLELKKTQTDITALGLESSELYVDRVEPEHPAASVGIEPGDRLLSVNQDRIRSFQELRQLVQKAGEAAGKFNLTWMHQGQRITKEIVPKATERKGPQLETKVDYTVGIYPMIDIREAEVKIEREWNPFVLLYKGTLRMVDVTYKNIMSIGKMILGQVSYKTLGGPILIGKIAGDSLERGLIPFLTMMAVLSIGLGVLNVLPVPVLDGGHILLLGVESIRKKPLSMKQMEVIQQAGLLLILMLMAVVFKNDFSRLSLFN